MTVRCFSDAVPPPFYSWYRKFKDFRGQFREEKIGEDNKSGELTLPNIMINETGEYKCIAFNYPDLDKPAQVYSKQDTMKIKVICKLLYFTKLNKHEVFNFSDLLCRLIWQFSKVLWDISIFYY